MINHFPHRNDGVNDRRRNQGYANGFVVRVLYDDGPDEVMVKFDDGIEFYDFEEFRHSWNTRLKVFELSPEVPVWRNAKSR